MAAKIAIRSKSEKVEQDFEPFVVIDAASGRRVYGGDGVPEDRAQELSENLAADTYVVPLAELDRFGRHQPQADGEGADQDAPE